MTDEPKQDIGSEPAFPAAGEGCFRPTCGMTLREWYAGLALQGVLAARWSDPEYMAQHAASDSFAVADAMIQQIEKRSEQ